VMEEVEKWQKYVSFTIKEIYKVIDVSSESEIKCKL
jgi:hypothetical protein